MLPSRNIRSSGAEVLEVRPAICQNVRDSPHLSPINGNAQVTLVVIVILTGHVDQKFIGTSRSKVHGIFYPSVGINGAQGSSIVIKFAARVLVILELEGSRQSGNDHRGLGRGRRL